MTTNNVRARALTFAINAHGDQRRKYTNEPYIIHPVLVALKLEQCGFGDDVIAAGYLHDVLEDTPATFSELASNFGMYVAYLVAEVTDVSKPTDGNRATRKKLDLRHLSLASPNGQSIKLADLIDNTSSIVRYDRQFAPVYLREKAELLKVLTQGHPSLLAEAKAVLVEGLTKLGMKVA